MIQAIFQFFQFVDTIDEDNQHKYTVLKKSTTKRTGVLLDLTVILLTILEVLHRSCILQIQINNN